MYVHGLLCGVTYGLLLALAIRLSSLLPLLLLPLQLAVFLIMFIALLGDEVEADDGEDVFQHGTFSRVMALSVS